MLTGNIFPVKEVLFPLKHVARLMKDCGFDWILISFSWVMSLLTFSVSKPRPQPFPNFNQVLWVQHTCVKHKKVSCLCCYERILRILWRIQMKSIISKYFADMFGINILWLARYITWKCNLGSVRFLLKPVLCCKLGGYKCKVEETQPSVTFMQAFFSAEALFFILQEKVS